MFDGGNQDYCSAAVAPGQRVRDYEGKLGFLAVEFAQPVAVSGFTDLSRRERKVSISMNLDSSTSTATFTGSCGAHTALRCNPPRETCQRHSPWL